MAAVDAALLERRRRRSFKAAVIALLIGIAGFPLGLATGDRNDTAGGALFFAAIAGLIASPWIVRAWQGFMRSRMIEAAVAGRPDIHHIDVEKEQAAARDALASEAFSLAAFRDSGLVEPFRSAGADHILTGTAHGVPFGLAEIVLLDEKGYRLFRGVLGSFRLAHPRPGLTVVTRDHGLLGNIIASVGSKLERLPLEDPSFEGVFQVYGTDQVVGRVVLTTTMLERLKTLDELARAHGFACAFLEDHLMIAFHGMTWRCPSWRILEPVASWIDGYASNLAGLVDLPTEIVQTLNLAPPSIERSGSFVPTARTAVVVGAGSGEPFSSWLWRLVGEGGMAMISIASGSLFGFVALFGAWYGVKVGFSAQLFWYFWTLISAGVIYGAFAIASGLRDIAKLIWRWDAPLRTLRRS